MFLHPDLQVVAFSTCNVKHAIGKMLKLMKSSLTYPNYRLQISTKIQYIARKSWIWIFSFIQSYILFTSKLGDKNKCINTADDIQI